MNRKEALGRASAVAQLFAGQVTEDQGKFLIREFEAYGPDVVDQAIREHRRTHEFVSIPALLEGCRAADAGESNAPRQVPTPSLADVIRAQWPQVRERGDWEVLLRYWRGDWHRYESAYQVRRDGLEGQRDKTAPEIFAKAVAWMEQQRDGYWRKVYAGAVNSLVAAGMDAEAADLAAQSMADPPDVFRHVLADLRENQPAGAVPEPALPL